MGGSDYDLLPDRWGVGRAAGSVIKQRGQKQQKYLPSLFPAQELKDPYCTCLFLAHFYVSVILVSTG